MRDRLRWRILLVSALAAMAFATIVAHIVHPCYHDGLECDSGEAALAWADGGCPICLLLAGAKSAACALPASAIVVLAPCDGPPAAGGQVAAFDACLSLLGPRSPPSA
jgi:hypothetical protein